MTSKNDRRTIVTTLAALSVIASACGGSESTAAPVETAPVETAPVVDDPLDVEFASEPIDAGPLFGSADNASVEDDAESADGAIGEEVVEDAPEPPVDPEPTFVPAEVHRPFCSLLDDLNGRPFPSDELEAARVASVWIGQLGNVAVPEITADLGSLVAFLDTVVESDGDIAMNDIPDELDAAVSRVDIYVETECYGNGATAIEPITVADE